MDFSVLLLLGVSMLGIAILTTLNSIRRVPPQLNESAVTQNEFSTIKRGYAYTVDMGDSLLIVAVIDKNNGSEIMLAHEDLLEVRNIADRP
ncbi:MAG: hypothetical protein QXJ56_00415 [Ignisphaera sp.]|uniref:Uncharacterized protein n=1 Tax=Ignisphaera aggregans TaxID=334771 RepID=A0A7J3I637_9CREN